MKSIIPLLLCSFVLAFPSHTFSQTNPNLIALDTIDSNQEKLDYIGKTLVSQLYSNPENIATYANMFDSIANLNKTIENQSNALNFKGMAHYVSQEYDSAINYYLEAVRILETQKPGEKLSRVYNNLAACYNIRKDFSNTEKYFLKSLDIASAIDDKPWVANINNNLSILYMQNELYGKAEKAIDNALNYFTQANDSIMMGIAYMNYGNSKLFSENFDDAVTNYNKAIQHVKMNQVPIVHAVAQTGIGIGLSKQQHYNKALPYLKKGVEIAKFLKHNEQLMESYNALANHYSETKDYKNAFLLSVESQKLKDSVLTASQDQNMADALTKFETEKKDTELKLLKVEGEKKEQQKRLYLILALTGLTIASLLGFFVYNNKKKNKTLANQKSLLEKTIDEKNVLLKETHHRVKNSFQIVSSLLFLQSKNIKDKEAQLAIKEAQNRVRSMVLIHQKLYNKEELVGIDTKEYFEDLVRDIFDSHQQKSAGLKYQLHIDPMVLNIETITPIGLILNELVVNVLKHAFKKVNADSLMTVHFNKVEDRLLLKVSDNGVGLSKTVEDASFGIKLIKALSKKLKASITFNSEKNKGTEALLNITKFEIY